MTKTVRSLLSATALFAASGFLAFGAQTASAQAPGSDARMQKERAACDGVQQDRAACIREAGAARQAAARGGLTSAPDYRANALARCSLQPPTERSACEARVLGSMGNTRSMVDGSVMGGGVIRESVTTTMVPVVPAPEPMPMPMRPMR